MDAIDKEMLASMINRLSLKNNIIYTKHWQVIYANAQYFQVNQQNGTFKILLDGLPEFVSVKPFEQAKAEALQWLAQQ